MSKSLVQKPEIELAEDFSTLIKHEVLMDNCEIKRNTPLGIDTIRDFVGGQNMQFICCNGDQSLYVYKTTRNQILQFSDNPKYHLKYFKEKQSPLLNAFFVIIDVPKTSTRRDHMVLLGSVQSGFADVFPKVGFARKFDIVGKNMTTYLLLVMPS